MIGTFIFSETSPNAAGTVASSQAVTNSTIAGVAAPLDDWDAIDVTAEFGGATGGTLDVYIQVSPDQGASWYDIIHFSQATALSAMKFYQAPLSLATTTTAPVAVGKNLSPSLGAGSASVVNGAWCDRARLVMVAGTGTSAGTSVVVKMAPQRVRTMTP